MMLVAYELRRYVNSLQGAAYEVRPTAICIDTGDVIYPSGFRSLGPEDAVGFERGVGRELLVTFNDLICAEECEALVLEYRVPEGCKSVALLYHVRDLVRGGEWIYAEVYSGRRLVEARRLPPPPEKAAEAIIRGRR